MRSKSLKKLFATALAFSLVMAPVMGVSASTNNNAPSTGGSNTTVTAEEAVKVPVTSKVTVGGRNITTTVKGAYMSKTIPGTAIVTDLATLASGYGLGAGEQPYAKIFDINAKRSPAAMASINSAANAIGGNVVATVNLEIGKMSGGKYSILPQDGSPISLVFGIPKNAVKTGHTYTMICVRPGGVVEMLPDLDEDPNTVTFNTTGGLGAYAMVSYPNA